MNIQFLYFCVVMIWNGVDLGGLNPEKANITQFTLATDNQGEVFKRQAIRVMKDQYGISLVSGFAENIQLFHDSGLGSRDIAQEREQTERDLDGLETPPDENGNTHPVEVDNPADGVNAARSGILDLVLDSTNVSEKSFSLNDLASHRNLDTGDGMKNIEEDYASFINELLFTAYIANKYSCYTKPMNHEALEYEMEYILCGKSSDRENLKGVVKKLLLLRETANVIYLFSDSGKIAEAEALAVAVASAMGFPLLIELLKWSILFAWAFAESVIDVRTLLSEGKVPLIKTAGDWILSLENLPSFLSHIDDGKESKNGLDYTGYLQVFLYLQNKTEKVFRAIDVIELNLRRTVGNEFFRMDGCMEYIEAEVELTSRRGYKYKIRRDFSYW